MDLLKKIWPTPFKIANKDVAALIIHIVILVVAGIIGGLLIGLLAHIPVVNIVCGLLGALLDVYCVVGIVLCFLKFFDVIK